MNDTEKIETIKQEINKRLNTCFYNGNASDLARKSELYYLQYFIEQLEKDDKK